MYSNTISFRYFFSTCTYSWRNCRIWENAAKSENSIGMFDKCHDLIHISVEIVPCWLNYCNYHAFDAFAMLHCYGHANKVVVVY